MDVNWKGSKSIAHKAMSFGHTGTLALNFQGKVYNSLISEMEGSIHMEWKGCELIIHGDDCDLLVNMEGWVDIYG